jgi:hypothetical protein
MVCHGDQDRGQEVGDDPLEVCGEGAGIGAVPEAHDHDLAHHAVDADAIVEGALWEGQVLLTARTDAVRSSAGRRSKSRPLLICNRFLIVFSSFFEEAGPLLRDRGESARFRRAPQHWPAVRRLSGRLSSRTLPSRNARPSTGNTRSREIRPYAITPDIGEGSAVEGYSEFDEVAVGILDVREGSAGCVLAAADELASGGFDFLDGGIEI